MSLPFQSSATAALDFLSSLLRLSVRHAQRECIPSTLEMLTVCRETGCKLPELECYARSVDQSGVVLLCGGSPQMAAECARKLGLDVEFHAANGMPVMWWVYGGAVEDLYFRHGFTETRLKAEALRMLLDKNLGRERLITVRQRVVAESDFTFIWLPDPIVFEDFIDDPAAFELFLSQRLTIELSDETPLLIHERLKGMGQFLLRVSEEQVANNEVSARLDSMILELMEMSSETREELAAAIWAWLVPRLIEAIERTKQQYAVMIDKQQHKLAATQHLLREYRRNWVSGIKNEADAYLQKRIHSPQFEVFYDGKQPGPEIESFLTAVSVSALRGKLTKSMTDRIAEFVAGLSALANKVELRQISLKDIDTRWNPQKLNATLEAALAKQKVFTEGGGPRVGLVGALTGKSSEILNNRKGQIAQACRFTAQAIEADFALWCDDLMKHVEKLVRVQLAANLVNQNMPEAETLREAIDGLVKLAAMINGEANSESLKPETIVSGWLGGLKARRFVPSYQPPPA